MKNILTWRYWIGALFIGAMLDTMGFSPPELKFFVMMVGATFLWACATDRE